MHTLKDFNAGIVAESFAAAAVVCSAETSSFSFASFDDELPPDKVCPVGELLPAPSAPSATAEACSASGARSRASKPACTRLSAVMSAPRPPPRLICNESLHGPRVTSQMVCYSLTKFFRNAEKLAEVE